MKRPGAATIGGSSDLERRASSAKRPRTGKVVFVGIQFTKLG